MFALIRFRTLASLLILATVAVSPLSAQGIVSGLVLDETNELAITGASVRISELNRDAITDRTGRFQMVGIPAGTYTLSTRYLGFVARNESITVSNNSRTALTLRLTRALTQLGTVVVTSTRTGQAAALSQQQNSANITNVVAADQIGRFPDANIGDALKRVPGITIALDQGEARFGSIRGTEPRFNSVMVNGERIPSAEAEVRQVQLDLIPADMVQALEVNKTLTPEMDADAIGGAINVVTRAAPAGLRISSTLGSGYNFIREKPVVVGSFVAGNRFLDDRFGAIISGSYYDQQFGSDNKEGIWNRSDDGDAFVEEFDVRRYDVQRLRRSISGSFDMRFNADNIVMLRSLYNHRNDYENRFRLRYAFDEPDANGIQEAAVRRQTKGGGPHPSLKQTRLEDQRTQSHQLSGEHLLRGFSTLTWSGGIARASETRPDERYVEWQASNVDIAADYTDQQNPQFTAVNPSDLTVSNFAFRRFEILESFTKDSDRNARIDLLLPFKGGESNVKIGLRYRGKEKLRTNTFDRAVPIAGSSFANMGLSDNRDYTTSENLSGNYQYGSFSTPGWLASQSLRNSAQFTLQDQPGEYAAGNFDATEAISAGYGQIERHLSSRLSMIVGARVEATKVDYNGVEYDVDTDDISPTSGSKSYVDVMPSASLRWDAGPATVVRAAWTNTLARPNYYDLVPYRAVSLDDDELSTGNPDLKTTRSMNFDLMAERYFESVGLVSVGVFHKRITDFIFNFTEFSAVDPVSGTTFSSISQPRNGAEATITGAEIAMQRQLDFLPGILQYAGIYANYTFNESGVNGLNIPGRDLEDLPLLGTAKHSGNLSLSFDPPRASLRVAFNYQSEALDAGEGGYNEDAFFDRWADRRVDLDANASYQITSNARLFVEANNLTNRPLRFYQGTRGRVMQDEYYGRRIQTGVKFDF